MNYQNIGSEDSFIGNKSFWVSSWNSSKVKIGDEIQFGINSFWRSLKYYVDSSSEQWIELGTKGFPYRSLHQSFIEIISLFSNSDIDITIYIKEETITYLEDSKIYLINIPSVIIKTYSENGDNSGSATMITTDSEVEILSSKASFNLVKSITVDISSILSSSNLTTEELQIAGRQGDTFQLVRSSISINNLIVRREAASLDSGTFLFLIYLQNNSIYLSKNFIDQNI